MDVQLPLPKDAHELIVLHVQHRQLGQLGQRLREGALQSRGRDQVTTTNSVTPLLWV